MIGRSLTDIMLASVQYRPERHQMVLGRGARLPRAANPSPRNDASATALRGAFEASVRILLSNILMPGDIIYGVLVRFLSGG